MEAGEAPRDTQLPTHSPMRLYLGFAGVRISAFLAADAIVCSLIVSTLVT
jgi:hypothetical protein